MRGDTLDREGMAAAMKGCNIVYHLAANADVRDGWNHPDKDLQQNTIATFHVLEAIDPADTILDYARVNNVDHLVMGARANSTMRKLLGSVSGKVAAEAPCSVTVVRNRVAEE